MTRRATRFFLPLLLATWGGITITPVSPTSIQVCLTPPFCLTSDSCPTPTVPAAARYVGNKHKSGTEVRLRIGNGGAGQSGLVGALASSFIDWSRDEGGVKEDYAIDWVLGDTTGSIENLASGNADIAITYNAAAEYRAGNLSISTKRVYGFRDHFLLVGPPANPADLKKEDSVFTIMNKIVTTGNKADGTPPTRFLSRYDKSATNIKESLLFAQIGQIPWACPYSTWYHQYPTFPIAALTAASLLEEYTLTDRGTFLTLQSQNRTIVDHLVIFRAGADVDPQDPLLNPASVLLGAKVCQKNLELAKMFMEWMVSPGGGQSVVGTFQKTGVQGYLYTTAPNCTAQPAQCAGW